MSDEEVDPGVVDNVIVQITVPTPEGVDAFSPEHREIIQNAVAAFKAVLMTGNIDLPEDSVRFIHADFDRTVALSDITPS